MNNKWEGSNLVLDPEQINQARKNKQKKFSDKTKFIRKFSYAFVGIVVVALTISLSLTLGTHTDTASLQDQNKSTSVSSVISSKDKKVVNFNVDQLEDDEINPNDVTREDVYNLINGQTTKIKIDVLLAVLTNEVERSTTLGNVDVLRTFVIDKILKQEEKTAKDNDQNYLYNLMVKGFGSTDESLNDEEKLIVAKQAYVSSTAFLNTVYETMFSMLYLTSTEGRIKNAASKSLWREAWYMELKYSGDDKNTITKELVDDISNWNTYASVATVNLDETFINSKEDYQEDADKRSGYVGFIKETTAPSEFTTEIKNRVFRSTSGDQKFESGIQTEIDFDNNEYNYFIIKRDDETRVAIVEARLPNEDKYLPSGDEFKVEYLRDLLYTVVTGSSQYFSSATDYYFSKERYRTTFTDTAIKSALKSTLDPNDLETADDEDDDE